MEENTDLCGLGMAAGRQFHGSEEVIAGVVAHFPNGELGAGEVGAQEAFDKGALIGAKCALALHQRGVELTSVPVVQIKALARKVRAEGDAFLEVKPAPVGAQVGVGPE